ncbi:MAG: BrnT family toxin [Bryobacterales bacterium]|nr:BrnT family toxin [Bryobacterales bacterium]
MQMQLVFEWDPRKDRANLEKHRVSFSEASSVFGDPLARIFADKRHSEEEPREIIIGHTRAGLLLLVCFTERREGRVRIISARRVTRNEQQDYESNIQS